MAKIMKQACEIDEASRTIVSVKLAVDIDEARS